MKKNDIDKLLDNLNESPIPKPNPDARKKTINLATEIFRQGFDESTRPIDEPAKNTAEQAQSIWSKIMNFLAKPNENRTGYHALGTAVAAIAVVSVVFMSPALFKPQESTKNTIVDEGQVTVDEPIAVDKYINEAPVIEKDKAKPNTKIETKVASSNTESSTLAKPQAVIKESAKNIETKAIVKKPDAKKIKKYSRKKFEVTQQRPVSPNINTSISDQTNIAESTLGATSPQNIVADSTDVDVKLTSNTPILTEEIKAATPIPPQRFKALSSSATLSSASVKAQSHNRKISPQSRSFFSSSDAIAPTSVRENRDEFANYEASSIKFVADEPLSTFSADVDTASYSLVRNQLNNGRLPAPKAVRIEELINYFDYNYPLPRKKSQPFSSSISVLNSPWNADKKLVHIGIKGYEIDADRQPDSNLVFLLDVSGSMNQSNKLPLVKQSVNLLLNTLKPTDTVSIVVYAAAAGAVLEPTQVKEKTKILNAIRNLRAGGSTAGGAGIRLAYQLAEQNFNKDAVNRIILATDGDFNVGQQSNEDLKTLVERKRDSGVFLSVLGFGRGNYQDDMMQTLAQNGNGVAAYIDTLSEAKKVLVDQATSTLFTIAKDVKLQVEFNPATVSDYRLVGYETRALKKEDFNNDKVDAGDIGAGHTVTAIYEITPRDASTQSVDTPRYTANQKASLQSDDAAEYGFLKIRYKLPDESKSQLIKAPVNIATNSDSTEAKFSVAVAGFGQLLANGKHTGKLTYDDIIQAAQSNLGKDPYGYRAEFIQLVRMAKIANH